MTILILLSVLALVAIVGTIRALRVDGLHRIPACAERIARYR